MYIKNLKLTIIEKAKEGLYLERVDGIMKKLGIEDEQNLQEIRIEGKLKTLHDRLMS